MKLRLGFHYHIPVQRDEHGQLYTPGYLGRFLDSLAEHCETLICFMHSPRPDELPQMDYQIQSPNLNWIDIGPHVSIPRRVMNARSITEGLRQRRHELDAILIRGPSPLLPAMANAAADLPVALLLVGDYLAGIDDLPQPRWRKEAIRLWSWWNARQQLKVARRGLTFVNSHKLYEQLQPFVPNLHETRTTTLSEQDFYEREDTCQGNPIRLLYTGRMDRAKGLFEMVQAVEMLCQQGYDVVLDLVGWPQKGDTIVEELLADAQERELSERVIYHGFKAVGPELFAYYKQADIYLIASQSSEGFPRTIWEAMAHSLPVVATKVGSIPSFLEHGKTAWMVAPKNILELADGIVRVIDDIELRQGLILHARELARENTLEERAKQLYERLHSWVGEK